MSTLLVTHTDCLRHAMLPQHPERPARLASVLRHLEETGLSADLLHRDATAITLEELEQVHDAGYLRALYAARPAHGLTTIDPDTFLCPDSLAAAELAAGAVRDATTRVLADEARRAFCAVRPPGHHAEFDQAMGFCFFNNVAIGAAHALASGLERVAILDFDVHHGNGTVDIFRRRTEVLVCSSFQHPFYPHRFFDVDAPNIVNTPLEAGTRGDDFLRAVERDWVPALERHRPELILVSAGFDAHRDDPLGGLDLVEADYRRVTDLIVAMANDFAKGRVVSVLEGGYDLRALSRSVAAHVEGLLAH
jgi:acetoin utilization deacetylase AcuC-like enzyme